MKSTIAITPADLSLLLRTWRGVISIGNQKGLRGRFSQPVAAAHIGVPLQTYRNWEQGIKAPDALKLTAILARLKSWPAKK